MKADNGAEDAEVKFYLGGSEDTPSWAQLGATQMVGATTSIHAGTADVILGETANGGDDWPGKFYRAIIKDGIAGTTVFDADFTDRTNVVEPYATFTEDSVNAAEVTISRSATGLKSAIISQPVFLLATDDYLEVADHADLDFGAADSFTVIGLFRSYDVTPAADMALVFKKDNLTTSVGYGLYNDAGGAGRFLIADSVADDEDDAPAITNGEMFSLAGVRDVVGGDIEGYTDGVGSGTPVADSTTLTIANAFPLRIGSRSNAAASFLDGEFFGAAIFRYALTAEEIDLVGDELQGVIVPIDVLKSTMALRTGLNL